MNILHLTPDFNYSDGRSYYVYLLLKYFKKNKHNVMLCTNTGNSFDRLNHFSIPFYTEKNLSAKSSFLKSVNFVFKLAEENKIDIIHSHHRYFELIANAVRKKLKLKTVFTALSIVDRRYFVEYRSDKIIAVSNSVREMLIRRFKVSGNKIQLIPNCTDTEELKLCNKIKSEKKPGEINLLSVGRFHKEKDVLTLVRGVSLLTKRGYKLKLTLIGEGSELGNIKKVIGDLSVKADILSPRKDIYNYIRLTDICVLTSVRDPLPSFMLQSGLFGKPFIGSDVDGIADTIVTDVNGLLFKKKNEDDLAKKISLFANDKKLADKCGKNLRDTVLSSFTEKTVVPEIETLYRNLL